MNLTVYEACILVRENLHALQLSLEAQNLLLEAVAFIESDSCFITEQIRQSRKLPPLDVGSIDIISWPWEWNWFGRNKEMKSKSSGLARSFDTSSLLQVTGTGKELPGTVYVGSMEAFAGALFFTLGLVFPPAYGVGSALVLDGLRRVLNGLEEIDKLGPPGLLNHPG